MIIHLFNFMQAFYNDLYSFLLQARYLTMDHIKLTQEVLSVDEVTRLVTDPGCGAVSLFVGTTRDNFQVRICLHFWGLGNSLNKMYLMHGLYYDEHTFILSGLEDYA